jgi:hypothetical protein
MSTVFPDADAVPVEPPVGDEEPLEQPTDATDAIDAIATAASAGVSLLPFKVCFLSLTGSSAGRPWVNTKAAIRDQMRTARGPANTEAKACRDRLAKYTSVSSVVAVVQLKRPAMEYPTWPEE